MTFGRRILGYLQLLTMLLYIVSTTLFVHSHNIDGHHIVHSHPFSGTAAAHTHSSSSAEYIEQLSSMELIGGETPHLIDLYATTTVSTKQQRTEATITHHNSASSLRAPPYVLAA